MEEKKTVASEKDIFEPQDKITKIMKRFDTVKRDMDMRMVESLDFLEDPDYILNAKKDIEDYVKSTTTFKDKCIHFLNIFSQFSIRYNQTNELVNRDITNVIKTKRVEYVTTLPRFNIDPELTGRMTIGEQAEYNLVNELKTWGQKYALLSMTLGLNFGVLLSCTLFRNHRIFARTIFSFSCGWFMYTYLINRNLDKMYYPLLPIFTKYRELEKKYGKKEFDKIVTFKDSLEPTSSQKRMQERKNIVETMSLVEKIDQEIYEEREQAKTGMENLLDEIYSKYINEEHFERGAEGYEEFLEQYIH